MLELLVFILEILAIFPCIFISITFDKSRQAGDFVILVVRWDQVSSRWTRIETFPDVLPYIHSFSPASVLNGC